MPKKAIIAIQTTSDLPRIRSRDPKTTWAQYQAILEWLEIPANFNLVEGRATSTMEFSHYNPAPNNIAEEVMAKNKGKVKDDE